MPPKRRKTANKVIEPLVPAGTEASGSKNATPPLMLTLPTETIQEIISYIPDIQLPIGRHASHDQTAYPVYEPSIPATAYIREDLLRALSQTCRAMRLFFLPLLWAEFNIYSRGGGEKVWYKRVSEGLEQGSNFLMTPKNKLLASHVQFVS